MSITNNITDYECIGQQSLNSLKKAYNEINSIINVFKHKEKNLLYTYFNLETQVIYYLNI